MNILKSAGKFMGYIAIGAICATGLTYSINGLISNEWNIYKQKDAVYEKILENEIKSDSTNNLEKIIAKYPIN